MRVVLHETCRCVQPDSDGFLTQIVRREDGTHYLNNGRLDAAIVFNWCGMAICGGQIPDEIQARIANDYAIVPVAVKLLS